jgi:hypothetical protein
MYKGFLQVGLVKMLGVDDAESNLVQGRGNLAQVKRDYLVAVSTWKEQQERSEKKKNPGLQT